ncbi:putative lipoprotein [Serinicoccus hydrothermalis]|uniref:Putative lipoprotein n=1 Tax=Serinicoccus hydrothermalis TaxID=1758689 RepID=A0A1B1NF50_9MICO|nr:hypothetical protein [Serinicoccus hydrothermalis]ANS80005.1 putative lipoprotein [Serinicoccus hydrothermalis]
MTTARTSRPARRAGALLAAGAALVLAGCSVNSPAATTLRYAPADGVELDGDTVDVRDLLVVSHGEGAPAVVSGSVINSSSEPVTVLVSVSGTEVTPTVSVGAHSTVRLDGVDADGSDGEPLILPELESPAGQTVEVRVEVEGQETLSTLAPVLLPQGPYAQFVDDAGGPVETPAAEEGEDDH